MSWKFKDWIYCSQIRISSQFCFKLQTKMSTKVYCKIYVTAFYINALSCGQQGRGSSNMTMSSGTQQYLSVHEITVFLYMHFSTVSSPCQFFLFPWLTHALRGHYYVDIQAIQIAGIKQLCSIPESNVQGCFKDLQKH